MYQDDGTLNEADLFAWVQDAPDRKPLAADNQQGMISFADTLNNDQISDIIEYLKTLGDAPLLPSN